MPRYCVLLAFSFTIAYPLCAQSAWTATSPMHAAHTQDPATLLPDGRVLVVGTLSCNPGCISGSTAELYNPASSTWSLAAPPQTPRFNHIAELLPGGRVLVAGGYSTPGVLTGSAEIYDPVAGVWSATGSLATPRQFHRSAVLNDGRVLVTGGDGMDGHGSFTPLSSAELYDPAAGRWTSAGNISVARWMHSVTALRDGRVLVAGGSSSDGVSLPLSSAEIYNPATNGWTPVSSLLTARAEHRAVLLPDGRVLVAGGVGANGCLADVELYDPAADRWTAAGPMTSPRIAFEMTLLPSGQVLAAAGGSCAGVSNTAEIYDPGAGNWSAAPDLTQPRVQASLAVLASGKVLLAGGQASSDQIPNGVLFGTSTSELFGTNRVSAGAIATVSAASYLDNASVAPESLAAAFGSDLAQAGVSVTVQDSLGVPRPAPVLSVSSAQIDFQVPPGTAPGRATVTLGHGSEVSASGSVLITPVAPGLFSADGSGEGLAAAVIQRIRADGSQNYEPVTAPVDLGPGADSVYLVLFGTGIRGRSSVSKVTARIGAARLDAAFAGPSPEFPGVDQVNVLLPSSLAGSGEVSVTLTVEGFVSNSVRLTIR